jgi:uncharacterized membrane protein YdfJ with MMPL/SSD domain
VILNDFLLFTVFSPAGNVICFSNSNHRKTQPMKRIVHLYQRHPVAALIIKSIGFLLSAAALILIIIVLAVAFTG